MSLKVNYAGADLEVTLSWPSEDDPEILHVKIGPIWHDVGDLEAIGINEEKLYALVLEHEDLPRDYAEYLADREAYFAELAYDVQREDK